jgi:hypothetical protein
MTQSTEISGNGVRNGSVILCERSHLELMYCQIVRNSASDYWGGVVRLVDSAGQLTRCLIAQNVVLEGYAGAISMEGYASIEFLGCTIADNVSETGAGANVSGGATAAFGGGIVWGNRALENAAVHVAAGSSASLGSCAVDTSQV